MSSTHLQRLVDHLAWADRRTLEALRAMHAVPIDALRLYGHLLAAEETWLSRIEERPAAVPIWPSLSLEECEALAARNHVAYRAFAASLAAGDAGRALRYRNSQGEEFTNTVEEILLHVALHGSYHRGQVARIVRGEGATPLATDYIVFIRNP
jgi:uncharacterized damage-inducible protein DinB